MDTAKNYKLCSVIFNTMEEEVVTVTFNTMEKAVVRVIFNTRNGSIATITKEQKQKTTITKKGSACDDRK